MSAKFWSSLIIGLIVLSIIIYVIVSWILMDMKEKKTYTTETTGIVTNVECEKNLKGANICKYTTEFAVNGSTIVGQCNSYTEDEFTTNQNIFVKYNPTEPTDFTCSSNPTT